MKLLKISLVSIVVLTIISCAKQVDSESCMKGFSNRSSSLNLVERFESRRLNAIEHGEILSYTISYFNTPEGSRIVQEKSIGTEQIKDIIRSYAMSRYPSGSSNRDDILEVSKSLSQRLSFAASIVNHGNLLSEYYEPANDKCVPDHFKLLFTRFEQLSSQSINSFVDLKNAIIDILHDVESKISYRISDFDIEGIAYTAAVMENSIQYWIENYSEWERIFCPNATSRILRGFWGDLWKNIKEVVTVLAVADAAGAAGEFVIAAGASIASGGALAVPAAGAVVASAGASSIIAGAGYIVSNGIKD